MRRVCLFALLVIMVGSGVGVYAVSAAGAPKADGKLFATVGPSFSILLRDATGASVTHLDPGTYEIEIDDRSVEHNFHLFGPGPVSAGTEIEFVGIRTVTVTLVNGQYTFVCDLHPYDMIGQFTVGTAAPPPPTTATTLPKLVGTVGPGFTISLTRGGRKVRTVKPGRYTIVVRDRSTLHNFHLIGPSVNKATGIAFVGTRTWTVRLFVGLYRYRCDPHRLTLRGSFTVAR